MSRGFTLTQLVARVREDAGYENDDFVDDAEIKKMLSESYTWLYDLLAPLGYFRSTQSLSGAGSSAFALPSDYRSTLGVTYDGNSGQKCKLKRVNWSEAMEYTTNSQAVAEAFDVVGGNIELYPPPSGGTYTHYYVPAADDLTADETVDGVSGWEELMVVNSAIKVRTKARETTTALERRQALLLKRVEEAVEQRVMGEPGHIHDREAELGEITEAFRISDRGHY